MIDVGSFSPTRRGLRVIQLPFASMIHMIEYKCKLVGIDVVVDTEPYTSKASFIGGHMIPCKYDGEKGLYKSKAGFLINADVNGGYNTSVKKQSRTRSLLTG